MIETGFTRAGNLEVVDLGEVLPRLAKVLRIIPGVDPRKIDSYIKALQHEKIVKFEGQYVISTLFPPVNLTNPSRAFKSVINRGLNYPMMTHVSVTDRCNRDCQDCSQAFLRASRGEDLSTARLKNIFGQIQDLGSPTIAITGGEPLLRPDLEELIEFIDDRSSTMLFTAGPLSLGRARRLKDAGLFTLSVSSNHHNPATNDRSRFPGSYKAVRKTIESGLSAGLFTVTNQVVDEENFNDVEEYISRMGEWGVHGVRLFDRISTGACSSKPSFPMKMRQRLIELHKEVNADPTLPQLMVASYIESPEMFGCGGGGSIHMYINARGELCVCDFAPIKCGDLKEESLSIAYRRMREDFPHPICDCIMKCNPAIAEALEKGPVDIEQIRPLVRESMESGLPGLYRSF